jgi:uridine kinase
VVAGLHEDVLSALALEADQPPVTVLIDGPSGAGKTHLADALETHWPAGRSVVILHLDDVYPGWRGLDAASEQVGNEFSAARAAAQAFTYSRWDWVAGAYAEQHTIGADVDLIIEGCGAITAQSARLASLSVWVDETDEIRRMQALSRGGEDFELHWEEWEEQFAAFVLRENPQAHASMTVGRRR